MTPESGGGRVDPIIRVENVRYEYASETAQPIPALRGLSLSVGRGEYVAVAGANGSGKSTLARHLNGLLVPDRGEVWVKGWNTRDTSRLRQIRSTVGMVFQNPDNQIVATIVEEDVAFGPENLGVAPGEIRARVDEALRVVGLEGERLRAPHLLSGGQKQRVCIAGILALRPEVLVLDESTSMLDPAGRRQVLDLASRLHREGLTVVAITHHMEEAAEAERLVVLEQGRVALDGSPRQIFARPEVLRPVGLETPQITELAHRLHRRDAGFPADVLSVEELVQGVRARAGANRVEVPAPTAEHPNGKPPAIQVEAAEHYYLEGTPLEVKALDGASLEVRRGEILGIIGPTGSGKSTLVQHFNGLLRPSRGAVRIFGQDTRGAADLPALRRRVGFLFQQPEAQLFEHYVGDDVAFGPRNAGLSKPEVRERVRAAMESVGLGFEEFKDRLTLGLSGGQRRRVALAGVLALEPEVLVLDEPTSGLDPAARRELLGTLRRLRREQGVTLVVVSHDMEELAALCDRIAVVAAGRVVAAEPAAAVFGRVQQLRDLNLDVPAVTAAVERLRLEGFLSGSGAVLTVDEAEDVLARLLA